MATDTDNDRIDAVFATLRDRAEDGRVTICDVGDAAKQHDLDEEAVATLQARLANAGIEIDDDCGKEDAKPATYTINSLARETSDALAQFLDGIGRYRLLRPEEELELARRIERG